MKKSNNTFQMFIYIIILHCGNYNLKLEDVQPFSNELLQKKNYSSNNNHREDELMIVLPFLCSVSLVVVVA